MATLQTSLKSWGSAGSEYPDNYSYVEGEQPVDEWDNYLTANIISDIQDVIDRINAIDSDGDAVVDQADAAKAASTTFDLTSNDLVDSSEILWDTSEQTLTPPDADIANADHKFEWTDMSNSGVVSEGDFGVLFTMTVEDGQTIYVTRASFHEIGDTDPVIAASSGTELAIADSAGIKQTILSGDGTAIYGHQTGNPLASYTNTTGSPEDLVIGVDNGQFGTGAGGDIDAQAGFIIRRA